MVIIRMARPEAILALGKNNMDWIFLGKDSLLGSECSKLLDPTRCLDVAKRFHAISLELRQPFLDFVAQVGSLQRNQLDWHSSSFAWKDSEATDLYLLICQFCLVRELVENSSDSEKHLLVLIEDQWLFEQCRREFGRYSTNVDIGPTTDLRFLKLKLLARALVSRGVWLLRILREYAIQRWQSRHAPVTPRLDCLLYSLPHERCFDIEDGWRDPFLGDLDKLLTENRWSVGRLAPIGTWKFASQLARRSRYVYPMILQLSFRSLLSSLIAFWRPQLRLLPTVAGLKVPLLAEREWWVDFAHAS